ncbi:50S ribosomal protein L30 [bacterium]|nr:50S ribosomal protein L30 [bacterium]
MTSDEKNLGEGAAKTIRVKQIRGTCGRTQRVKRTLEALGLGRIGKEKELPLNGPVAGMVRKVRHLVSVDELG